MNIQIVRIVRKNLYIFQKFTHFRISMIFIIIGSSIGKDTIGEKTTKVRL